MRFGPVCLLAGVALPVAASFAPACVRAPMPLDVPPPTTAFPTASLALASPPAVDSTQSNLTGPDEAALDRSAAPCEDFYQFACGGWMKATPIPEDEANWVRSFSVLHEENQKALRVILTRDAQGDTRGDAYGRELGDFWSSCMDEASLEKRAASDIRPELERIEAVRDAKSLVQELARLHAIGVGVAFGFDSEIDMKNAARMI